MQLWCNLKNKMETNDFKTVQDVIDYLKLMKAKNDKLQKANPDFNISLKTVSGLPIDLIFDLYDFIHEGDKSYVSSYSRVQKSGDHLTLSGYSSRLPINCSFQSIKVRDKKELQPLPERTQYEAIPQ